MVNSEENNLENSNNIDDFLADFSENDSIDINSLLKILDIDDYVFEKEFNNMNPQIDLVFRKKNKEVKTPEYVYKSDSGFDLYSIEEKWIHPFDRTLIPTGLHIDIPDGYEIQVRSKSGLALKQGLMVLNSPGTVDQGYLGEIQVILFNTTNQKVKIEKGQKIAQAVLCPVVSGKWINLVESEFLQEKDRNNNGFGSSGI